MPLETEVKLELDAAGAARVMTLGSVERRDDQLNVYYDDAWRLSAHGMTVRVRLVRGAPAVLTAKVLQSWDGYRRTMQELEMTLGHGFGRPSRTVPRAIDVGRDLTGSVRNALIEAGFHALDRVGWVRNLRTVVALPGGQHIEIDRTRLPDGTISYEVEIETEDREASDRAVTLVRGVVPTAAPSPMGKYGRLRRALRTD